MSTNELTGDVASVVYGEPPIPPRPPRFRRHTLPGWVVSWIPAMICIAVIATESTESFSASHTSYWLYPLWLRFFGPNRYMEFLTVHFFLRKTGHFVGYGLVSVGFFTSWFATLAPRVGESFRVLCRRVSWFSLACTLLIASADEFHQSFVPGREAAIHDVAIDMGGALTLTLLLFLMLPRYWDNPRFRHHRHAA